MGRRLYVGNLPYDVDEASLREVFGQDGRRVERVHIPLDRETQRPRGFAFIEFATDEQAQQALAALDGKLLGARAMRVSEAQDDRRPAAGVRPGPGGPPRERAQDDERGDAARDDGTRRENRFGPDARPKHEREKEYRRGKPHRRRPGGEPSDDYHGRRGNRRFDDEDF